LRQRENLFEEVLKMKKLLLVFLVILFCASGFAFAGTPRKGGEEKMTFAIIPMFVGHPWFVRCELGAKKAAEELGIDYVFVGPEKADAAKQLDIFNDQVNKGVDAIILAVSDAKAWEKPVQDTQDKGVPVFGFDIGAPNTIWLASGWETVQSGINIGEGLAKEIGGNGKVVILTGSLGSPFLAERQKAIEDTLAKYPGIQLVGVFATEDDYEKALSQCESVLQAHPDLAGFASTVTTGIPAAAKAVENAKLGGEVAIWGVALGKQNAEYVKKGWVKGALILDPAKMTYIGVKIAYNYLTNSGQVPEPDDDFGWAGKPTTLPDKKATYALDVLLTPANVDDFEF
jgi:ABC-type sugar transport system substrate-binding protein